MNRDYEAHRMRSELNFFTTNRLACNCNFAAGSRDKTHDHV